MANGKVIELFLVYGTANSLITAEQNWMECVYDRLPLKEGAKVLEIGCETGNVP